MIKFKGDGKTGPIVGLGISEGNVERLKAGKPISINLKDLGLPDTTILIWYGVDEADCKRQIEGLIGPDTKTHVEA